MQDGSVGGRGERLQKVMAAAGIASRRACEDIIRAGRVEVNGAVVTELGVRVRPGRDRISVDGRPLPPPVRKGFTYVLMHKPPGLLTAMSDPRGEPTVADLLPRGLPRVFPVGRLDRDSSGLLLFTNHGDLAARLLHPRYEVPKTYEVTVRGRPSRAALRTLREGVRLSDGVTAPAKADVVRAERGRSVLCIVIREGRKRQVRRMMDAVGHPVERLVRTGFGPLRLGSLPEGAVRRLDGRERQALLALDKTLSRRDP